MWTGLFNSVYNQLMSKNGVIGNEALIQFLQPLLLPSLPRAEHKYNLEGLPAKCRLFLRMPLLSCTVSLHIFSFLSPSLDVCTWLGIVGGLLEFKWFFNFFNIVLLVMEWSVFPLEMILALDVLHWKLNHLIGCCAAQPGVVVPHSSLPCWHVSCNSSML